MKNIFQHGQNHYPNLESIKDALCKCGQNGRAVCKNMVVMEMHFARARGAKRFSSDRERGNPARLALAK